MRGWIQIRHGKYPRGGPLLHLIRGRHCQSITHCFPSHPAAWDAVTDMLLLLSPFSRVRLSATPALGVSRQGQWSGLPFPSPMHKSEKWKWSHSVMSESSRPHGLQPTRLLCLWDFPGKSTGVGCHCLLRTDMLTRANTKHWNKRRTQPTFHSSPDSWVKPFYPDIMWL